MASQASATARIRAIWGMAVSDEAVGIALAVEPLVVTADAGAEVRQPRDVGDDPLADDRVLLDVEVFLRRQRPFLAEDRVADADLAEVVQEPGEVEVADLASSQAHLLSEPDRDPRDPLAVAAGVRIFGVDRRREAADDAEERLLQLVVGSVVPVVVDVELPDHPGDPQVGRGRRRGSRESGARRASRIEGS